MRSHINSATFTKRIPTDNYAYEEYSLTAAIDPSESGEEVLIEMRSQVSNAFAADLVASTEKKEETKAAKKSAKQEEKKSAKPGKSKARPADDEDDDGEDSADEDQRDDGEGAEDDEAADDNVQDDGDDSSDDAEETEDDGDSEEEEEQEAHRKTSSGKAKPAAKEEKSKKGFKRKPQVYNRGLEQHKEIFSGLLRSVAPDWKRNDASKLKAKKASEQLEGEDFLDESGEVLDGFVTQVKKLMGVKK